MTTLESTDDVLTLLVHLGYLTYDFYEQKVCIPNQEVQKEFITRILFCKKDYLVYRELAGGKGYADMVFVPRNTMNRPVIVVELKWKQSAGAAIAQIKKRQYVECLKGYTGEVILVGVNYDAGKEGYDEYKKHDC